MKFWDSSAVIPLLVMEPMTSIIGGILAEDRHMHVWWATEVECASALARLERENVASLTVETAFDRLAALREDWSEIAAGAGVRDAAKRLLRVHPLRAADSLQLAAASVLADGDSGSVTVVSLDDRLRDAARREGFHCSRDDRTEPPSTTREWPAHRRAQPRWAAAPLVAIWP